MSFATGSTVHQPFAGIVREGEKERKGEREGTGAKSNVVLRGMEDNHMNQKQDTGENACKNKNSYKSGGKMPTDVPVSPASPYLYECPSVKIRHLNDPDWSDSEED